MSWERHGGLRAAITQLAAQIMYGEDVKQYFTAKRLAAKRLLGRGSSKSVRYRPQDLPSNGEIKQALLELVDEIEGSVRTRRLFAMRIVALEAMAELEMFSVRLIGSVATGHVRSGSDIDLHVFAEHPADVVARVRELGWTYETQHVNILKHGKVMEFTHVLVADVFPLELTVYAPNELAHRPRSSTDGKPIVRVRSATLRKLCEREHPEMWARYLADGTTPTMEELLAAELAEGESQLGTEDAEDIDVVPWLDEEPPDPIVDEDIDDDDDDDDDLPEREPRIRRTDSDVVRREHQRFRARGSVAPKRSS